MTSVVWLVVKCTREPWRPANSPACQQVLHVFADETRARTFVASHDCHVMGCTMDHWLRVVRFEVEQ